MLPLHIGLEIEKGKGRELGATFGGDAQPGDDKQGRVNLRPRQAKLPIATISVIATVTKVRHDLHKVAGTIKTWNSRRKLQSRKQLCALSEQGIGASDSHAQADELLGDTGNEASVDETLAQTARAVVDKDLA